MRWINDILATWNHHTGWVNDVLAACVGGLRVFWPGKEFQDGIPSVSESVQVETLSVESSHM